MQIKFISNSGQVSEIIFLILTNKNALKKIGLKDNLLLDVLKALENKGFGFNKDEIIELYSAGVLGRDPLVASIKNK